MAGAFYVECDVYRPYVQRCEGGRKLRSIEDLYEIKKAGTAEHLENMSGKHRLPTLVREHEKEILCRLGREFLKCGQEVQSCNNVEEATRKEHTER